MYRARRSTVIRLHILLVPLCARTVYVCTQSLAAVGYMRSRATPPPFMFVTRQFGPRTLLPCIDVNEMFMPGVVSVAVATMEERSRGLRNERGYSTYYLRSLCVREKIKNSPLKGELRDEEVDRLPYLPAGIVEPGVASNDATYRMMEKIEAEMYEVTEASQAYRCGTFDMAIYLFILKALMSHV